MFETVRPTLDRRRFLASSAIGLLAWPGAPKAQGASTDTDWRHYGGDLASSRYAPLDQINAENFNTLSVAWRFSTNALGRQLDAYYNATPLIVGGRLFSTAGNERYVVSLDGATGQQLWTYRHNEGRRLGTRGGSGFGLSYWNDGPVERILYVTRSYQLVSLDAKTGLPDPAFGVGGEVDLRKDWDQEVDPARPVAGLHAAPLIVGDTIVVGTAPSAAVKAHLRAYDVRTGQRKWIFHTVPQKGEFGYDTWIEEGQAEATGATGVWAPMSADPELGLVYVGVELPPADLVGVSRKGSTLFAECIVALDIETGVRRWHYQMEHHGLWDRDVSAAPMLCDFPLNGRTVKALAQLTKQGFCFVLDRATGKPVWPIREQPVAKGDVPGEWYSPTQPVPSRPPPFERQGVTLDDLIDYTPAIKARAAEIASHYRMGPLYTPPAFFKPDGPWGTLVLPATQGGANWPGGSYDPETSRLFVYTKRNVEALAVAPNAAGVLQGQGSGRIPPNVNDNDGGAFGGNAGLNGGNAGIGGAPRTPVADKLTDPVAPGILSIEGIALSKPPYGRIVAIDLAKGDIAWAATHGETPDAIKNHPLLRGVDIPRTGQAGILGVLATKTLVICGDCGLFTDETGRKAARLRAYDKQTGREVGAVVLDKAQTGSPMTYMLGGKQYVVLAIGGQRGAELVAYRLGG